MVEIHKIAAMVIKDDKILMVRKQGKEVWTTLGGRPERQETEEQALLREIIEEVDCEAEIIRKLGDFKADAIFHPNTVVRLSTYLVKLIGEPNIHKDPELEECMYVPKNYKQQGIKLPTDSMENQIIPYLIKEGLLNW